MCSFAFHDASNSSSHPERSKIGLRGCVFWIPRFIFIRSNPQTVPKQDHFTKDPAALRNFQIQPNQTLPLLQLTSFEAMATHRLFLTVPSRPIPFFRSSFSVRSGAPFLRHQHHARPVPVTTAVIRRPMSDAASIVRPGRPVTREERLTLRAGRKQRAAQFLQQAKNLEGGAGTAGAASASATAAGTSSTGASTGRGLMSSKYVWYASVGIPSALLIWGFSDGNSPPAKFSQWIGLTGFIRSYTDEIAKPSHDKLLPDWSQVGRIVRCNSTVNSTSSSRTELGSLSGCGNHATS
jgi:hypothetical protein